MKRTTKLSRSMANYWAAMSPEERREEAQRRLMKRKRGNGKPYPIRAQFLLLDMQTQTMVPVDPRAARVILAMGGKG